MTPERIEELRDLFANYLTRSSDENKLLAFASEILDIAERFARIAAILEPLRALEAAATEAPWHVQGQGGIRMDGVRDSYVIQGGQADVCKSPTRPGRDRNPEGERVNFQCIAAAEARPEPAAEPSRFADAVRNAREAAEHMAMRPTGPSDGVLAGITMWLCDAVEALAREMREVKK